MHPIEITLRRVRQRLQWQQLWANACGGMLVSGAIACGLGLLRWWLQQSPHAGVLNAALEAAGEFGGAAGVDGESPAGDAVISGAWVLGVWLLGPVVGGVLTWLRPCSSHAAAVAIDGRAGLQDRVQTAASLLPFKRTATPLQRLQLADAEQHLQSLDVDELLPIEGPRLWPLALTLAAAALLLAVWPQSATDGERLSGARVAIQSQAARLAQDFQTLQQLQQQQPDPALASLLAELHAGAAALQHTRQPLAAMAQLSDMETALEQRRQPLLQADVSGWLQEIGAALQLAEALTAAGLALQQGDAELAAAELSQLELPQLTMAELNAVTAELQRLQSSAAAALATDELPQRLDQLREGLEQQNAQQFQAGAAGLAAVSREQALRERLADQLRRQLQHLNEYKAELASAVRGSADVPAADAETGGSQAGTAARGLTAGEATAQQPTGAELALKGRDTGTGAAAVDKVTATDAEVQIWRQFREQQATREALNESVLESESLPLAYRRMLRQYFESIRPALSSGEADGASPEDSAERGPATR